MKRYYLSAVLLVANLSVAGAEPIRGSFPADVLGANGSPVRTYFSTAPNPSSGLRGWHIDRPSSELTPHGISLDLDGRPVWDMGIDYESPDLILAYSHITRSDQVRIEAATGQVELGARVGHPATPNQVNVTAGTAEAPLDGVGVGCYGSRSGLYLYQKLPRSKRTKVSFYGLFQIGTDSQRNDTPDFFIGNNLTGRIPLHISQADHVTMGYGATIGGTLRHTGAGLGVFGANPIPRPEVTGSRKDGTALASLLTKLAALGFVRDKSTD